MNTKIVAELAALEAEHGVITAQAVVDRARDPDSPMHAHFEWDDTVAAERHREDQARALIRSVQIEITRREITFTVPKYISDPTSPEHGYRDIAKLRTDPDVAHEVIATEMARAAAALRRAKAVAAGLSVESALTDIHERITTAQTRMQEGATT
jgi:hypothetical protein